jgi:two-component system nitrogen regulation response regulator GlnG
MARVLLVDDDWDVLESLADCLRGEHEVTVADGFPEAIAALAEGPRPDVVITDREMPPYDGAELLEIVARRYPGVCRVLHTGTPRTQIERAAKVADYVLVKGCDLDELRAVVRRCRMRGRVF